MDTDGFLDGGLKLPSKERGTNKGGSHEHDPEGPATDATWAEVRRGFRIAACTLVQTAMRMGLS